MEDNHLEDHHLDDIHDGDDEGNVKVMCRFRPVNNNELQRFGEDYICEFTENHRSVTISSSKQVGSGLVSTNKFTFDRIFDMNATQREVYEVTAKPIIEGVLKGFNGTVFAYGQTGSGKTHTMQGPDIEDLELQGIVPRMVRTVFNRIENMTENIEFTIKVSMVEIYMEHIRDLLDPTKINLKIKENKQKGIYIHNLTERYIGSDADVYKIMKIGNENRKTASTAMNDTSSRSHSIFIMSITQNNLDDFSSKSGTLYLVDLAGSEKVAKTNVSGQQLDEAKGINLSLSTLGKVIHALTDKKITHVPYRESKLTRILTESLGGNAKTCLIITCSPSPYNELETVSTLRFGTAARNIKNKPKVNKEYTIPELKRMVAKRDQLISALRKRVKILEEFIRENGLEPPSDEALAQLANKLKEVEDEIVDDHTPSKDDPDEESDEEEEEKDIEPQQIIFEDEQVSNDLEFDSDQTPEEKEQREQAKELIKLVENISPDNQGSNKKIIAKYLELQELLTTEREKSQTQLDVLSDMKEDYEVVQNKLKKYQAEKEDFLAYKEQAEQKLHSLKEQIAEFENERELKEARMQQVETELAETKKVYLSAKNKIAKYEEHGTDMLIKETQENKEFRKDALEGHEELRHELKVLHDELKRREEVITQIQGLPDLEASIKNIIKESRNEEGKDERHKLKENSELVKKMLFGDGDEQLIEAGDSCYLSPKEVIDLMTKQKKLKENCKHYKSKNSKLKKELTNLKQKLNEVASADNPDLQAIVDTLVDERLKEHQTKYVAEREKLMNDLADRVDKVCTLKIQLDTLQEDNARLELMLNNGDYSAQKQINYLEKQIENLSLMYHQSASEVSVHKVDLQVADKKLRSKDVKIKKLEETVIVLKDTNKKLTVIAKKLRDAVENENRSRKTLDSNNLTGITSQGRVVKKIKPKRANN